MMIYLLEWTPCIHESMHTTLSAHTTKRMAFKRMLEHKKLQAKYHRESRLRYGGPKGDKPERFEQFFIRRIELCE